MPNFYSTNEFESRYTYTGTDLGAVWSADKTDFRVWAPTAEAVQLCLYKSGTPGTEDLMPYIPKKVLIRKWLGTVLGFPLIAAAIAGEHKGTLRAESDAESTRFLYTMNLKK